MDILIIITIILSISFWAYCNIWYQKQELPLSDGYLAFSFIQWILIYINIYLISNFLISTIITLSLFLGGAVILTNFTTNQLYRIVNLKPKMALAFFSVLVWILLILMIIKIFI
jgi:hypothetical protein